MTSRYVCPECYASTDPPKRNQDARCQDCRDALPVNGKPQEDEDDPVRNEGDSSFGPSYSIT